MADRQAIRGWKPASPALKGLCPEAAPNYRDNRTADNFAKITG